METEPRDMCVYHLLYPVATEKWPKDTPLYVGKGNEKRPYDHLKLAKIHLSAVDFEMTAKNERNKFKLRTIRKILKSGHVPVILMIATGLSADEANVLETSEIARIGRVDLGLGPLTNLTDGGEGTRGYKRPDTVKARDRERESDPDTKELARIRSRALMRFPEIQMKQRINHAAALKRPEVIQKNQAAHAARVIRYETLRSQSTPEVTDLCRRGYSAKEISEKLRLPLGRVQRILKDLIETIREDRKFSTENFLVFKTCGV